MQPLHLAYDTPPHRHSHPLPVRGALYPGLGDPLTPRNYDGPLSQPRASAEPGRPRSTATPPGIAKALDQVGATYGYQWAATRSTATPPGIAKALDLVGATYGHRLGPSGPTEIFGESNVSATTDGWHRRSPRSPWGRSQGVLEASYPATGPFTPGRTREPLTQLRGSVNATDQRRARNRLAAGLCLCHCHDSSHRPSHRPSFHAFTRDRA